MAEHEWVRLNQIYLHGHITNNCLSKTKGVIISTDGSVLIGYFDQYGSLFIPNIVCYEGKFEVSEWYKSLGVY